MIPEKFYQVSSPITQNYFYLNVFVSMLYIVGLSIATCIQCNNAIN